MNATRTCTWCGLSVGANDDVCRACGQPQRLGVRQPFEGRYDRSPAASYPRKGTSGLAIASLVFGILGLGLLPFLGPIVAIVCANVARRQYRNGETTSNGVAIAGSVLGWIGLVYSFFWLFAVASQSS